ncbi:MAG: GNAT family N-acetyltransferase, partial [Candidatus Berkiella sp.]
WFFHDISVDEYGNRLTHIVDGPNAIQLHWDMIESLAVLIQKGYDLIIDEVLWENEIFERYIDALCFSKKVFIVKVICDLIECERRENEREDRFKGLARGLYSKVYTNDVIYDLEVDTTSDDADTSAKHVIQFVESMKAPQAFLKYISQKISFTPLQNEHFALLQRWLNTEEVAMWWSKDKAWSRADIEHKYRSYVQGVKMNDGVAKPIYAFIIQCANKSIGFIQYYNVNDFNRDGYDLPQTTEKVAAIDFFIGEQHYLNKSLGTVIINQFIDTYIKSQFTACYVDPDNANVAAKRTYEKSGFKVMKQLSEPPVTIMIKKL